MKLKRVMALFFVGCLALGSAACTKDSGKTASNAGTDATASASVSPSASATTSASASNDGSQKYTISAINFTWDDVPPSDGAGLKAIDEKFNVDYKPTIFTASDYPEKQAAAIAGGDVPDIFAMNGGVPEPNYFKWAKQGAFLPLDDYIDKFPTLKAIPKSTWDIMRVDGKIYGIPKYFPKTYLNTMIIRQDWLDNLGLKMPTNLEELKKVALAFTKNDPDKNSKNDTYGIVVGENLGPNQSYGGPYWDTDAWYEKDANGQYIPGVIGKGRQEVIKMLADLYKQGGITKDFAVLKDDNLVSTEFWSGKAGIFISGPRGQEEKYPDALLQAAPKAKLAVIPPFKDPMGNQGLNSGSGMYQMSMLSAKLKDNPGKVERILQMLDFGRTFVPPAERNGSNKDFDWLYGGLGKGYEVKDGNAAIGKSSDGIAPFFYMPDNKMWAPSDKENQYSTSYKNPLLQDIAKQMEDLHASVKHYNNPKYQFNSDLFRTKYIDLLLYVLGEQSKMVIGQRPVADWDKLVKEFMDKGGKDVIKEVNDSIKGKDVGTFE